MTLFSSQAVDLACEFSVAPEIEEDDLVLGDEQDLRTVGHCAITPLVWSHI